MPGGFSRPTGHCDSGRERIDNGGGGYANLLQRGVMGVLMGLTRTLSRATCGWQC